MNPGRRRLWLRVALVLVLVPAAAFLLSEALGGGQGTVPEIRDRDPDVDGEVPGLRKRRPEGPGPELELERVPALPEFRPTASRPGALRPGARLWLDLVPPMLRTPPSGHLLRLSAAGPVLSMDRPSSRHLLLAAPRPELWTRVHREGFVQGLESLLAELGLPVRAVEVSATWQPDLRELLTWVEVRPR